MPLSKGDYILLDYTIVSKDDGKVVETTNEDKAREAGIYSPDEVYEPRLVVIGETKLLQPLEEALVNLDEGQEVTIDVPPEKAFGQRDPGKVKVVSMREFYRYGKLPRVGDTVEINNQQARVIGISGGRVILDFNHPLAGKTLVITAKVVKKLGDDAEKIKGIIRQYLPRIDAEKIRVEVSEDKSTVSIRLPIETLFIDKIGTVKARLIDEIASRFSGVRKIVFIDEAEVTRREQGK